MPERPVLYSFRRCPYAMRARLALAVAGVELELREILLRDKPAEMLAISPKGTVPVLALPGGRVIDESLDVMYWALQARDPEGWLGADARATDALIRRNDEEFKPLLDRYKYFERYPEASRDDYLRRALPILEDLNDRLAANGGGLFGPRRTLADMAIFPFVRQFARADLQRFSALALPALQAWQQRHDGSDLFRRVMTKVPLWNPVREPLITSFG